MGSISRGGAYDLSPSPLGSRSPTLVGSRLGPDYDDGYSGRRYHRSRSSSEWDEYDRQQVSRSKDKIVKASIVIGLCVAVAGILHLRSKRERERLQQFSNSYGTNRGRTEGKNYTDDRRRQAEWDEWRENGKKGRLEGPGNGAGRKMIKAPDSRHERTSNRGSRV